MTETLGSSTRGSIAVVYVNIQGQQNITII